jgi:hypothetical protein
MLEMGQSKPWPEALEAMTGERQVDASGNSGILRSIAEMAGRAELRDRRWAGKHQHQGQR